MKATIPLFGLFPNNGREQVPCKLHNNSKSDDDEFLMATLAPVVGNNGTAYIHTNTKVARAAKRNLRLMDSVITKQRKTTLVIPGEDKTHRFSVSIGNPDLKRLAGCFEYIARGLWYQKNSEPFMGKVKSIPTFVKFKEGSEASIFQLLAQRLCEQEGSEWKVEGSNPEIFKYQFGEPDQFGITPLRMVFYGSAEILVAFQPVGVELPWQHKIDNKEPIDIKITFESTVKD